MSRKVIVVPAAPHYKDVTGREKIWFGRIFKGIMLARHHGAPLIIVGDANGGADVAAFERIAQTAGVQTHCELNGTDKNTRGDMRAAARVLARREFAEVDEVVLVTCWYHVPRCSMELRHALEGQRPRRMRLAPVWPPDLAHLLHGLYRWFHLYGEWRGLLDAYWRLPHKSRGPFAFMGKPDAEP